jgi:phosphatidate cytidylyltransferase
MREFIIRFLSSLLYAFIVLVTLFTSREWLIGLLFILAVITLNEFLRLVSLKGFIAYIILILSFYFISYQEINPIATIVFLTASILVNLFLLRDVLVLNKVSLFKKRRYFCIVFYIISGFIFLS